MKITKDNLDEVMFENQDARLLIEDVVVSTSANLYYFHDTEITVEKALEIWYRAQAAECAEPDCGVAGALPGLCLPEKMDVRVRRRLEQAVEGLRKRLEIVWGGRCA